MTIGHDSPGPVDKHNSDKNFTPPHPLGGVKGQMFKFAITKSVIYIFTDILHAGRGIIDLKHIKQDFSLKAWVCPPWWT